ncbi:C2H2 and C2HC zinc finger [Glarea lozoyensis ATCC 20868]|uniref:C2H2 type master regulator of conidiophore development brlA n=1 Tax=Glarea lozoyensis (strain ATCC 20868 / MF5171) TaxID=1116229 RepID=S3CHP3_GLAL2|nr:C2H2 and C2HC zinc finger [Glarea lozoyensis ATCC 20868]EPE25997.1 C2H2 and C2HC zinc finger [Glarea lozoyensis ATCC 20868]
MSPKDRSQTKGFSPQEVSTMNEYCQKLAGTNNGNERTFTKFSCTCAPSVLLIGAIQDHITQLESQLRSLRSEHCTATVPPALAFSHQSLASPNAVEPLDGVVFDPALKNCAETDQQLFDQFTNGNAFADDDSSLSGDADAFHVVDKTSMQPAQTHRSQLIADVSGDSMQVSGFYNEGLNSSWDQTPFDFEQVLSDANFTAGNMNLPSSSAKNHVSLCDFGTGTEIFPSDGSTMGLANVDIGSISAITGPGQLQTNPVATRHSCPHCSRSFSRASDQRRHSKKHQPTAQRFSCIFPGCGKVFLRSDHLRQHRMIHNPNGQRFPCTFEGCGKDFLRSDNLRKHQNSQGHY